MWSIGVVAVPTGRPGRKQLVELSAEGPRHRQIQGQLVALDLLDLAKRHELSRVYLTNGYLIYGEMQQLTNTRARNSIIRGSRGTTMVGMVESSRDGASAVGDERRNAKRRPCRMGKRKCHAPTARVPCPHSQRHPSLGGVAVSIAHACPPPKHDASNQSLNLVASSPRLVLF